MSTPLYAFQDPKFGFIPKSFPRDPIAINQFAEHMIIGHILQPLTDTDQLGNVIPSVASGWVFQNKGKEIVFEVDNNAKFSNGEKITSKDIKYTLDRHIKNKSQSSAFFRAVTKIEILNDSKIILYLKYADVSLIKVLSRDHLGIVPFGWEFNEKSDVPYMGSGPYNLKRENGKWFLIANSYNKNYSLINIKKAELIFYSDYSLSIDFNNFPDIVPLISKSNFEKYKLLLPEKAKICSEAEEMTFSQSSVWWNPHSVYFETREIRSKVFKFLDSQIKEFAIQKKLKLATSFIPIGVMGHLTNRIELKDSYYSKPIKIKISSTTVAFRELFTSEKFLKEMKNSGIEFIFQYITAIDVKKAHKEFGPDITIGSWGGGFNDPTGFLGPLEEDLDMSFEDYLGVLKKDFIKAQSEQNWELRANIFRNIARSLIENNYMIPGFSNEQYSCLSNGFEKKEVSLRYTPRLINYSRKN